MARVASSTTTSRRGSTRPAILRNPSRLMRAPPAPPQANGGMYLGGRTSSKTFAPVPITVPVPSSVIGTGANVFDDVRPPKRSEEHTSELQSHHELVCRL